MQALFLAVLALAAPPSVERTVHLSSGVAHGRFTFNVRAPAFRSVRVTVPHGAAVSVKARDAHRLAGVGVATRPFTDSCKRRGRFDVCETGVEGCPAPQGRWTASVVKWTRAPALITVDFFFASRSG